MKTLIIVALLMGFSNMIAAWMASANDQKPAPPGPFNCADKNPCIEEYRKNNWYHFANVDPNKFVQCSVDGRCYLMSCPPSLKWSVKITACDW